MGDCRRRARVKGVRRVKILSKSKIENTNQPGYERPIKEVGTVNKEDNSRNNDNGKGNERIQQKEQWELQRYMPNTTINPLRTAKKETVIRNNNDHKMNKTTHNSKESEAENRINGSNRKK